MPSEMGEVWHEATQGSTHGQINKYTWEERNHTRAPCVLETAPIFFHLYLLQALLLHLDQNLQDCFHHFEISWAGFQLEGVLDQVPKTQNLIKS